jgi:RHS repeat-associated protein
VPEAVWTTEYRLPAATVKETDPLGYVTQRTLNARNKVLHEERFDTGKVRSSSNSLVSDFTYDGPWVAKRTVSEGAWSQTIDRPSIDDRGRVLREVESWSSDSRHYKYTTDKPWSGRSVSVTETWQSAAPTQTRSSSLRLDSLGNLISRSQDDLTDSWVYDAAGLLALEQPTGKPATVYTYFQGQLVQKDFASESTLYRYFPRGLAQSVTDPSGRVQRFSWYDRGLLKTEDFGRGTQVDHKSYTYDSGGYLSSLSTGSGSDAATWTYSHGPRGELLAASQLDSLGTFQYGYDARRELTSIQPPGDAPPLGGSVSQSFDYDYLGRQVSRTRGASSWVSSWANGESTTTDPNSDVTRTLLDPRGRKARVRYQPGSASSPFTSLTGVDLDYDGLDQILAATELRGAGNLSVSYSYDDRSRLTRVDRGASSWVNFGYTSSDERLFVESPAGKVTFGYDSKDRLQSSSSPRGDTQFSWEDGGQRLLSVSDSSLQECLGYDDRGRISHVANQLPNSSCTDAISTAFARFDYSYDDRGNRLSETYSDQTVSADLTSYGYDKADRLIGVQYPGGQTKLYGLGGDGSRICEKTLPVFASAFSLDACNHASGATEHLVYQYDARGGLSSVIDGLTNSQAATYEADPAGRVKREVRAGTERTYGWDAGGRLIQATIAAGATTSTSSYAYDFAGLRISKTTAAGTTGYLWGDGELVEERLPGQAALRYENAAGMTVSIGGERLLHDALGSVVGRVGSGSATLFRYDAWGGFRGNAPSGNEPSAAYAGQHWDADSGLSYAQQRWYDPKVGRFLSEDPVAGDPANPAGLHAFGYANGNPLVFVDPSGEKGFFDFFTKLAMCPPAPPGSDVRRQCEDAATTVNQDPVGRLAVKAPFAGPALALAAGTAPLLFAETAVLGASLDLGAQTYDDPAHPKTLSELDYSRSVESAAAMCLVPGALKGISGTGTVGKVAVGVFVLATSARMGGEGASQFVTGIEQGDAGRALYGASSTLLSTTGAAWGSQQISANLPYASMPTWAFSRLQFASGLNASFGIPRINLLPPRLIPGTPGQVTGGNSTTLGANLLEDMGVPRSTPRGMYQAQHIIPAEFAEHPILRKIGMDMDSASNGIFLPEPSDRVSALSRHRGYHGAYSRGVRQALDRLDSKQPIDVLERQVFDIQQRLRDAMLKGQPLYDNQGATSQVWRNTAEGTRTR